LLEKTAHQEPALNQTFDWGFSPVLADVETWGIGVTVSATASEPVRRTTPRKLDTITSRSAASLDQ